MTALPERAGGLRLLRTVVLIVCLGTALNSVGIYVTWRLNGRSNDALCVLRGDLEKRVESSREFLRDHPQGFAGITAREIQDGIANQQRTIAALAGLPCPKQ